MRAVLPALALLLAPSIAHADSLSRDHVGLALGVTLGGGVSSGSLAHTGAHARASGGLHYGRFALLAQLELVALDTIHDELDSDWLRSTGEGLAFRVDLAARRGHYLQVEVGYTWRTLRGSGEVERGCGVFGPCDAGYYREVPRYTDQAPYIALDLGSRTRGSVWAGVGIQVGISPITIDRAGTAPDTHGALAWVGLAGTFGSD